MKRMTLLLVDDHTLFRKGIIHALQANSNEFKILEADNVNAAIEMCGIHKIDLMILDISTSVIDGHAILQHLKTNRLRIKTLILTSYTDSGLIFHLLKQGISGYLPKNSNPTLLLEVVLKVLNGGVYFSAEISEKIQSLIQAGKMPTIKISEKELQIIRLLAEGLTSKEIAARTGYTERTVQTKKLRLEKKLMAKSSAEIVNYAYKLGLLKI